MSKLFVSALGSVLALFFSLSAYAVAPAAPSPAKPSLVKVVAGPSATLTWTAATTNTDGTAIVGTPTFNVYQGTSATTLSQVQSGLTVTTVTITSGPGVVDGQTAYFAVTEVVGGVESAQALGSKTFPVGTPNAPTLTVQ